LASLENLHALLVVYLTSGVTTGPGSPAARGKGCIFTTHHKAWTKKPGFGSHTALSTSKFAIVTEKNH
jgi:hypothetical protein